MHYNPLNQMARIEKSNALTNKIIVKSLKSNRGDIVRAMNPVDLKMMLASVFYVAFNKLAEDAQRAYDYKFDKYVTERDCDIIVESAEFKPRPDVEIEEEVTAYFEINGKLQHREVKPESLIALPEIDNSVECLTKQMEMGARGMRYNPYSLADRLEKADILTNEEIMATWQCEDGDAIREMSRADFKELWKGVFSLNYLELVAEAEAAFEQACKDYVPERDGIENDPRKNFKSNTEFEIDQALNAYFEEHGTIH